MPDLIQYANLGATAVVAIAAFWAFVQIFKMKKSPMNGTGMAILKQLEVQNTNHLHSIEENILKGFDRMANKQDETNKILFELLGIMKSRR